MTLVVIGLYLASIILGMYCIGWFLGGCITVVNGGYLEFIWASFIVSFAIGILSAISFGLAALTNDVYVKPRDEYMEAAYKRRYVELREKCISIPIQYEQSECFVNIKSEATVKASEDTTKHFKKAK